MPERGALRSMETRKGKRLAIVMVSLGIITISIFGAVLFRHLHERKRADRDPLQDLAIRLQEQMDRIRGSDEYAKIVEEMRASGKVDFAGMARLNELDAGKCWIREAGDRASSLHTIPSFFSSFPSGTANSQSAKICVICGFLRRSSLASPPRGCRMNRKIGDA